MSIIRGMTAVAVLLVAAPLAAQDTTATRDTAVARDTAVVRDTTPAVARDSVLQPALDQTRAVDAELRVALFELAGGRELSALSRLEWLRASPTALAGLDTDAATRRREDLAFLLAETYYRLGMTDRFRPAADQLLTSGSGRYIGILRAQLMIDAYRRGDNARALELATGATAAGDGGLASLVAGLAQYRMGDYAAARASLGGARQAGGTYAPFAHYMDALAALQGDTSQVAAALTALQALGGTAAQEFADQVRLTAAALAYQAGRFPEAASLAEGVGETSGLAAEALLTRAWSLYKAKQLEPASAAFSSFSQRYPQLPQHDEARLMVGQIMMEAGRIDDAERYFQAIADSIGVDARAMQQGAATAMASAARALVTNRAAGLLYVTEPTFGKTIALQDVAGADDAVLLAALGGGTLPTPVVAAPDIVSMADIESRLDAIGAPLVGSQRRAVYVQPPGGTSGAAFVQRSDALRTADMQVALARYRVEESRNAQNARIALLGQMQQYLTMSGTVVDQGVAQMTTVEDSLSRLASGLATSRERVMSTLRTNVEATRTLAAENRAMLDSATRSLAASLRPGEQEILQTERQTAERYAELASIVDRGIEALVARHPVLALSDTVRRHLDELRRLAADTRRDMDAASALVTNELARLRSTESQLTRQLRGALASAESQRTGAETQLLALIDAELRARAERVVGLMRRDAEAAEYGSASASFFRAIEGGTSGSSNGTPGAGGGTGAGSSDAGGAAPSSSRSSTPPR